MTAQTWGNILFQAHPGLRPQPRAVRWQEPVGPQEETE